MMDIKKYFYSTQEIGSAKVYEVIVSAAHKHAESRLSEHLEFMYPSQLKKQPKYSMVHILFILKVLFLFEWLGQRSIGIKYKGYGVGRYSVATAHRDPAVYRSKLKFYNRLARILYNNCKYIDSILYELPRIKAAYIDHGCYSNGILYEVFSENSIAIYHDAYPYNLVRWSPGLLMTYEDSIFLPIKHGDEIKAFGKEFLRGIVESSENIPYMRATYEKMPDELMDSEYVIYAHSFTDAQLNYGYDKAFMSVYDWLDFTLEFLLKNNKKVVLKAHPNFFVLDSVSDVSRWDRIVFEAIKKKWAGHSGLIIIDFAVRNVDLLNRVGQSTTLISHHGNALLEGGFLGFKCISSSATTWKHYDIFNVWESKGQYMAMLSEGNADLKSTNVDNLYSFCGALYDQGLTIYGNKNIGTIMSSYVGQTLRDFIKNPSIVNEMSDAQVVDAISRVYDVIAEV